jgi:hypothetical protein
VNWIVRDVFSLDHLESDLSLFAFEKRKLMLNLKRVGETTINPFPEWPLLRRFQINGREKFEILLRKQSSILREELHAMRNDVHHHDEHVTQTLAVLYAHFFDYIDAPDLSGVEDGDAHLVRVKQIYEREMIEGLRKQFPPLTRKRLREVIEGAYQAVAAGKLMYDKLLTYFQKEDTGE